MHMFPAMMNVSRGSYLWEGRKVGDANSKFMNPIEFRNVARYVQDVQANLPLYQALGFEVLQQMGTGMAVLKNSAGLKLVLHSWDGHQGKQLDTALGFTITGSVEEARAYLEKAGFRLLREPDAEDAGFFYIYADLDGNPINLVGKRPSH
jgi:catechol 2,3-dioxygenase-like lactoylglutathione lyase family enzyme